MLIYNFLQQFFSRYSLPPSPPLPSPPLPSLPSCMLFHLSDLMLQLWKSLVHVVTQEPTLTRNRHIDQLLMCALYGVCRVNQMNVTFKSIIDKYNLQPQASARVCPPSFSAPLLLFPLPSSPLLSPPLLSPPLPSPPLPLSLTPLTNLK